MTGDLYVVYNPIYAALFTVSANYLSLNAPLVCSPASAGVALSCVPVGLPSITALYTVTGTGPQNILVWMTEPSDIVTPETHTVDLVPQLV